MRERAMGRMGGGETAELQKPNPGVRRSSSLESKLKSKFVLRIVFSFVALVLLMHAMKARGGGITFSSPRQNTGTAAVDTLLAQAGSAEEGAVAQLPDAAERASESGVEGAGTVAINTTYEQNQPTTEQAPDSEAVPDPAGVSDPALALEGAAEAPPGAPPIFDPSSLLPVAPPISDAAAVPPGAPPISDPAAVAPGAPPISEPAAVPPSAPPISDPAGVPPGAPSISDSAVGLLSSAEAEAALAEAHAHNPNAYHIPDLPDFDVIPELPMEWPDRQQLERLASIEENKTDHQRIIVAAVTCNFLDVADNWLSSLERNRVWNYLILTLDEAAYDRLYAVRPDHVINYPFSTLSNNATYGSDGFAAIVKSRPVLLTHLLRSGIQFLYSDVDIFFLENPFSALPEGFDVVANTDSFLDQPPEVTDKDKTNICTGLMYLAPTPMTFELMYRWNTILTRTERKINQVAFNLALVDMGHTARSDPRIKLHVLDKQAFPPGFMYFGNKDWTYLRSWQPERLPVMVHNNYAQAKENKVSRFKDFDLWYPEAALENCWTPPNASEY